MGRDRRYRVAGCAAVLLALMAIAGGGGPRQTQVPTTLDDFFQRGTQPFDFETDPPDPLWSAREECRFCHGGYGRDHAPFETWKTSMMAQAARDPLFHAALAVAEQDAAFGGEMCLRCHAPKAWLEGRSSPTDGSALADDDFEGVTCIACHRMIDPIYEEGVNPPDDIAELEAVEADTGLPQDLQNGQFIIDRQDRRRGPFDLGPDFHLHQFRQSAFHGESMLCSSCHDVSNPLYLRQGADVPATSDTFVLSALDAPHPTQGKYDMFPLERTFSEWSLSQFADGPIDTGGRFGGNNPVVSTCQDCHIPDITGTGCNPFMTNVVRDNLPRHTFSGAANWILDAILDLDDSLLLYGEGARSGLNEQEVDEAKARNRDMLGRSADLTTHVNPDQQLVVRVTNQCGHKLPTGYPEGRRMWVNVRLYDADDNLVEEFGAYDGESAVLDEASTRVYEAKLGLDTEVADLTGLPAGETLHFALANTWLLDNRIPPRGFNNAAFEAVQAAPINHSYADGQHWDDSAYAVTCAVTRTEVRLYYQTASREYIEFLRDANRTNDRGQILYDLWEANGRGAPVEMTSLTVDLDCNRNGTLDRCDIADGVMVDENEDGVPDDCMMSSIPPAEAIDARQPYPLGDSTNRQGWRILEVAFNALAHKVHPEDFEVTASSGISPQVATVDHLGDSAVLLVLEEPVLPGAWTTITHLPSNSAFRLGYLPADASADGTSSPLDIMALVDILNGATDSAVWSSDINRSGLTEPGDILRVIDLLNGAGDFEVWNGRSLP